MNHEPVLFSLSKLNRMCEIELLYNRSTWKILGHPEGVQEILLRKEVIQPQLPLRLPCYDLAPVTDFTLGARIPEGLTRRRRVLPASMA